MGRFDEVIERKGTKSVKWDMVDHFYQDPEVLPMWVADMDFKTPAPVTEALTERVRHGIFGYTVPDDNTKRIITDWLSKRHGWDIEQDWIRYSPGVIPSLHMIIQSLTEVGDHILIQTPVYPPFYTVIKDHGRHVVKNSLIFNEERYHIDFDDFEEKIKENDVKMFILCNPHNPVGRVWTKEELNKMADICNRHEVLIVSDEIHADLVFKDHTHVPMASLDHHTSQNTITCMSPTKTFNLAGMQVSYVVTADKKMREVLDKQFNNQGMFLLNTLGITALEAAYQHGEEWLEDLTDLLESHYHYVSDRLHKETDKIKVIPPEGTYLLWLDCRELNFEQKDLKRFMQKEAKVGLNDGASFGEEGNGFMRLNIAAPKPIIEDGVDRIVRAVNRLQ
ncbi:MalY/PatB family protein [Halobacillus yeomjeoni]|uniref:cysteine-S-conjugate beta-lyase n=1 Tax=Halobacillus yeomjeoni TaxID=311194 RepID=A0A931MVW5_9BACI|nr:MalY/PatB family protein [Halobacillus yeomjeoni]MBH0231060.1 pyridoxal phosphate-dependent aminotransferase [Halobacillus yeomjeoni]